MLNIVYINSAGFLSSPYIQDASIPVKVSDEEAKKVSRCSIDTCWKWNYETSSFESLPQQDIVALRQLRDIICFPYANRGMAWYNSLTEDQLAEFNNWYKAWLDVTDTLEIPKMPDWLK